MAINVRGVWLTAVRAARRWKEAGRGGSIINIASIQGERVMSGITPYSTSKAAVVHMTKSLALEWARYGIRVNAIEPGYIGTEMTDAMWETDYGKALIKRIPMRRLGKPEELNGLFLLFATEAGSWMTAPACRSTADISARRCEPARIDCSCRSASAGRGWPVCAALISRGSRSGFLTAGAA